MGIIGPGRVSFLFFYFSIFLFLSFPFQIQNLNSIVTENLRSDFCILREALS